MRYVLSLLALSVCGCGTTNWFGWRRSTPVVCDAVDLSDPSLHAVDSVNLNPAPFYDYPSMEGPSAPLTAPLSAPESKAKPRLETLPSPTPDPST